MQYARLTPATSEGLSRLRRLHASESVRPPRPCRLFPAHTVRFSTATRRLRVYQVKASARGRGTLCPQRAPPQRAEPRGSCNEAALCARAACALRTRAVSSWRACAP